MVLGDDEEIGRLSGGFDVADFDQLPVRECDTPLPEPEEGDLFAGEGEPKPDPFEEPKADGLDHFPVFKKALKEFSQAEAKPKVVRIDTDETYGNFVCETAVKEIARRVDELRDALEEHLEDHRKDRHPGYRGKVKSMRKWDEIIGAAKAVADLRKATTPNEAAAALPSVPVDLPSFAEGKVKCWRESNGDVVCSIRFAAVDGTPRVATMAARPKVIDSDDEVMGMAMRAGVNPVTILGMLPDLAEVACAKRLVKDTAGAALKAHNRLDVCGMAKDGTDDPSITGCEEPLLLTHIGDEGSAPLAALMYLQQRCDAGDAQACAEMSTIQKAAATPTGREVAAPILVEAQRRLAEGKARKKTAPKMTYAQKYAVLGLCV